MASINPYLNFNGNAEEAFNFYKSVFGGEFTVVQRFGETPHAGHIPEADKNKIMHISLPIGKGNILMASDVTEAMGFPHITGNNFSLAVNTESEEEADKIFTNLSAGGTVQMPMQKVFWGSYFGMLTDPFGIQWMISHEYNQQEQSKKTEEHSAALN